VQIFVILYVSIYIAMPKILSSDINVNQKASKQVVRFMNKALLNKTFPVDQSSILQNNSFTANPIESDFQKFIQLCSKIVNEAEYLISNVNYHNNNSQYQPRFEPRMEEPIVDEPERLVSYRTPIKSKDEEDPFVRYEDVYHSPFENEDVVPLAINPKSPRPKRA
jgi:hypothetical protein